MSFIFIFFIVVLAIQFFYYVFVFSKFAFHKKASQQHNLPPISVIFCIKNDAELLKKNLIYFLNQEYPVFEIVLIDDASSDNSFEVMEGFEAMHTNIKLVKVNNVEAFWGNKKFALTLGIKAATHDFLLFTSIDCIPKSKKWIENMAQKFSGDKKIILGFVSYEKNKKQFLNYLYRFEKVLDTTSSFGWLKINRAYQGDGNNLAYHRSEFFGIRGFNDHIRILFGEDILFVNQASNTKNTDFNYGDESLVLRSSPRKFSNWFNEKRKKQAIFEHIRKFDQFQLKLFNLSQVLFVFLALILILVYPFWEIVLGLIIARYTISWTVVGISAKKLSEKDLIVWYPILEISWILIRINMLFVNFFSKPIS